MAQVCKEYKKLVEEKVEKPIDEWVEKTVQRCKQRKCKWWCACCNKWFCWLETIFVLVVRWVVVTVLKWVTYVICEVVTFIVNFLATFIGLILSIPILGRLINWIWKLILEIVWTIIGILDIIAGILGIKLPKKLRLCFLILSDKERAMATAESLQKSIESAKQIYKKEANVKIKVSHIETLKDSPENALDTHCDAGALGDDLWTAGTYFENNSNVHCFDSAFLRLIGYAAPVVVFVVRDVEGKQGCSLGPLVDYVTIEGPDGFCLAHEVGHACSLWHYDDDPDNLMFPSCGGTKLKKWQWIILRRSRHVTYL